MPQQLVKPKPFFKQTPGDRLSAKMEQRHQQKAVARALNVADPNEIETVPDAEEQAAKALGMPYERSSPKVRMREIREGFGKYPPKSPREQGFRAILRSVWP